MSTIFIKFTTTFFIALATCANAMANNVETKLETFNRHQNVAGANAFFHELDKAKFLDEKVVFSSSTPADSIRQQVWYWAAEWLYDQQQYYKAEKYAQKALPLYKSDDGKADCLNLIGLIYVRMGNMKKAAGYARKCLEIDLKSGDDDRISSSMNTMAGIYMAGHQAKEAEQYIKGALKHIENVDNPQRKAVINGMASEIYHTLGNDNKSLSYADEAYRIDTKLGRELQASIRLSQRAAALLGLKKYKEAEETTRKVIPVFKKHGDIHSMAISLNRLGNALLCQERQKEAIPYYREAAKLFSKMNDLYNEIHSHKGLYECYWKLNPDSAKTELEITDILKDSLYNHSSAEALSRYNAEFGNNVLQLENDEIKKSHNKTIIIGVAIIIILAIGSLLVIRHIRQRQQRQIQELIREIEAIRNKTSSPETTEQQQTENGMETEETEEVVSEEDRLFLMKVIDIVNEGLPNGLFGVEQIASQLNMSVQTFRRRLQNTVGETPKAYIQAIQMERAVKLLNDNQNLTIAKIASLCGFEETSSFNHTFKRIYGCSPTQFREKNLADN